MKISKFIKGSLLLALTSGMFVSCDSDDITLEDPNNATVENYFNNADEFDKAINGVYQAFKGTGLYSGSGSSRDLNIVPDLLSDNLIISQDGRGSNRDGHNWLITPGAIPTYIYSGAYGIIKNANLILHNIDNLPESDFPKKEQIRAEAIALRAIGHFEVARFYGKIPTQSADANSFVGIPYIDYYDPFDTPSRLGTMEESYKRIMDDLNAALASNALPSAVQDFKLSQPAVRAIAGRVALYMGNYNEVIDLLSPVVSSVNPVKAADLTKFWRYQISDGVLFQIHMATGQGQPHIGGNYSQGTSNSTIVPEYSIDKAFRELYNDQTEPERISATMSLMKDQWVVRKYMQASASNPSGRYMRVEEAILNLSEAYYLTNQHALALSTLNKLRDYRYSSYQGGETGDALFNAIQLERRKELAFESDRWFTIKRLLGVPGIPSSYHQGIQRSGNGYRADGTGAPSAVQYLSPDSHKWQMPISNDVLLFDPNITQTPGY